ncbi:MAG: hypothetical protein MUC28_03355, partial [Planctomycetes bacterium]|nr:hypothetical protein [Planctomycetota bacterium]
MAKKIFFLSIIAAIAAGAFFIPSAKSRIQPYTDGEAIAYQGKLVFGTANTGQFELFALENGRIVRQNTLVSDEVNYHKFLDAVFNVENGQLFVYLTNGRYLYKYRIVDFSAFDLIKKAKDNSGDFFYSLNLAANRISTVGTKGVKAWNYDLLVVDSHNLHNTFAANIKYSPDGSYIYDIFKDSFKAIDAFYRYSVIETSIRIREDHPRHSYGDEVAGTVYLVDDYSLVKFYLNNSNFQKFDHISRLGYDVDGVTGSNYVYFSDGIGIVKIGKSDLKPVSWVYTEKLGPGQGWSMGLRAARDKDGEKVIVFNGDSILVFNDKLTLLDHYAARESFEAAVPALSLSLDKNRGAPGAQISLRGSGFAPKEEVKI